MGARQWEGQGGREAIQWTSSSYNYDSKHLSMHNAKPITLLWTMNIPSVQRTISPIVPWLTHDVMTFSAPECMKSKYPLPVHACKSFDVMTSCMKSIDVMIVMTFSASECI